jgi:DNA-binding YbaB/EbfC family protein
MFKGIGNFASMLKQAQTMGPKMQAKMEEMAQQRVSGSAGGGMVTVEASGAGQVISVSIDPVLAEKNDLEMITDLLPAAINDALAKGKQLQMESLTEDLPIPGNLEDLLGKMMSGESDPAGDPPTPPAAPSA